jgi:predicted nuclease of predicted toxin-antitoxin system
MRVLLDECVPRRIRLELPEHAVLTVGDMGWSGVKNGQLLAKAAVEFDCLLTVDKNFRFQQSTTALAISVLVVHAANNKFETLKPLMGQVREALLVIQPRELRRIGA